MRAMKYLWACNKRGLDGVVWFADLVKTYDDGPYNWGRTAFAGVIVDGKRIQLGYSQSLSSHPDMSEATDNAIDTLDKLEANARTASLLEALRGLA